MMIANKKTLHNMMITLKKLYREILKPRNAIDKIKLGCKLRS